MDDALSVSLNKGYDFLYTSKDSTYYHFNKALGIAVAMNDPLAQLDVLGYLTYANGYYYDLVNYRHNLERTEHLLYTESAAKNIIDYKDYRNAYLLEKGNYYFKTKEYGKAGIPFQELIADFSKTPMVLLSEEAAPMLFSVHNFLATIYKHMGKYDLAEQYYNRNISLVETNPHMQPDMHSYTTNIHQLLGQLYIEMGNYTKANILLMEALGNYKILYKKDIKFKNTLVTVYQNVVENYIRQDSLKKGLDYLNESMAYLHEEDVFYKKGELLFGDIYSGLGDLAQAEIYYRKALKRYQIFRTEGPHQDVAEVYGRIAKLYLQHGTVTAGLNAIDKALNASGKTRGNSQLPDPEVVFSKRQLLQLLDIKIQLLVKGYHQEAKPSYLKNAIETNRVALKTFDLLKKEFESKLDKQFLVNTAYPIFHRMLAVTYLAYEGRKENEILELALNISEKNKDFLLLEALRNANATAYGGIPPRMLDREAQYKAEITHIEKVMFDSSDTATTFSEHLFALKQQYYGFLDSLKFQYPKYHDLKYQDKVLDLKTVRNGLLEENGILISYTVTDDFLYTIVLDKNHEDFIKVPFNETDRDQVRDFYKLVSRPTIIDDNSRINVLGEILYDKILKKNIKDFDGTNLTIIADDVLHYLPFDLLQHQNAYLLQTTSVSYANSISALLALKSRKSNTNNRILAFAPSFEGAVGRTSEREFGKLRYNDDEIIKIGASYDTEMYFDKHASLDEFKSLAPEFNVIHLATHASANDEFPDYSYLAFSEKNGAGNILYVKDIYNTTINADMVTLSACQTGIGKLQKGQGMLSLSKAFYFAGAKSLVNTLWKINDKSTVKLMDLFYKGLSEGKTKKIALRDAKLAYLATTDDPLLRHPYYWAAFVVSGDVSPLTPTKSYWFVLGAGGLVLGMIVYMFIPMKTDRKVA
tara:strand:+ start:4782 stop:7559 length:2778 start_codon:yes stop_codon:yes gene_type:complete